MAADEPAGPPPATAKSKSYRGLAGFITSLKYHLEKREAGNFFKPVAKSARGDSGNNDRTRIARVPGIMLIVWPIRSEEHTSELQSLTNLVCRLLLEKKKKNT